MLKKIVFKLDNLRYIINLDKNLVIIKNFTTKQKEIYELENIAIGEDWLVFETENRKKEPMIWDFTDEVLDINFTYEKV